MAKTRNADKIQPDWWLKTIAGCLLSLSFAYAFVAIFAWYGLGGIDAPVKVQFNMWIISPIWLLIFSFSYLFKTGIRLVIYLTAANILMYGIYFILGWVS